MEIYCERVKDLLNPKSKGNLRVRLVGNLLGNFPIPGNIGGPKKLPILLQIELSKILAEF